MARRLTLLALFACVAARRPLPQSSDVSESESLDPFVLWEDYEDTYETPVSSTTKPSVKVLLKAKVPENVSMKNKSELKLNGDDKNKIIKTTINIQSHTNIIVTKRPVSINSANRVTRVPVQTGIKLGEHQVWVEEDVLNVPDSTTKKPATSPRPNTTRKQTTSTTRRPQKTTRRRPTSTTRRQYTTRKQPKQKSTKAPPKKSTCPPKSTWWLSSFFQDTANQKSPKKQAKPGFFTKVYHWFMSSKSSWFGDGWFNDPEAKTSTTTTTTTPIPPSTSTNNWFQVFLESEENEVTDSTGTPNKKTPKKMARKNYKGYQLLRTYPDGRGKIRALLELQEDGDGSGIMWWTPPSLNGSSDILVPPDLLVDVKEHLKSYKIDFDVIIWDLQKAIAYENPRLSKKQRLELEQLRGHPMTWRRYHRYADILRYLEYLQHSYSDVVELLPLGRSSEGLPLVAVKVSLPTNETQLVSINKGPKKKWQLKSYSKPAVWLEGGMHAREWISPAVASWMLHTLVENPDLEMLKMADFYILPVLNPDGYEHSHTHDRLWRKTRSRSSDTTDDYYAGWLPWNWGQTDCVGVDADRNWDYHWGEKDSSRDPCSENYAGPHPFSEPETRAVSNFLSERKGQIKVYISLHAYSQAWLVPSSHAVAPFSDDGVLLEMGKLATAALADLYGTKYQVGTAAEIRQPASGMSHDWAKARAGIKFSYHVDLRDSFGPYGFLLPGSQIVPTARETWQAIKAIVDNLTPGL